MASPHLASILHNGLEVNVWSSEVNACVGIVNF